MVESLLARRIVDLTNDAAPETLKDTSSLTLVASRIEALFQRREVSDRLDVTGALRINPLYRIERTGDGRTRLTLRFPTPEYEDEFAVSKRYLPPEVTVDADPSGPMAPEDFGADYAGLRRNRVLLDVPPNYC